MSYVLDASSLLRFLDNEAGAERIEDLLNKARTGRSELLISAVNWGEIVYILAKTKGSAKAHEMLNNLRSLPISVVSATGPLCEAAAWFKEEFKLPYADAFAGTLARFENLPLVTADYDFKNVGTAIKVEFLPVKSRN